MIINEELKKKFNQTEDISLYMTNENTVKAKEFVSDGVFALAKIKGMKLDRINPFDHKHNSYEFIITINSIGIIKLNGACYMGQAGCCYPVPPMESHGVENINSDAEFFIIEINKGLFEDYLNSLGIIKPVFHQAFLVDADFYKTLGTMVKYAKQEPCNLDLVYNVGRSIMTYLITKGLENNEDQRRARRVFNSKIKNVLDYMSENFRNPEVDVQTLSEYSGFSHTYFTKTFKKYMGENPIVYLNKLRISEAKRMIIEDPYRKLNDIHDKVGFKTVTNFTEQFKLITGMKPKQYQFEYARPSEDRNKTRYQIKKEREALNK